MGMKYIVAFQNVDVKKYYGTLTCLIIIELYYCYLEGIHGQALVSFSAGARLDSQYNAYIVYIISYAAEIPWLY